MRLRHSLIEERTTDKQRIHAQLFHNGYPRQSNLDSIEGRAYLEDTELPTAARKVVDRDPFGDDRAHKRGACAHRKGVAGLRSLPGRL